MTSIYRIFQQMDSCQMSRILEIPHLRRKVYKSLKFIVSRTQRYAIRDYQGLSLFDSKKGRQVLVAGSPDGSRWIYRDLRAGFLLTLKYRKQLMQVKGWSIGWIFDGQEPHVQGGCVV